MTYSVIDLKCPGCGEPVKTDQKCCKFCGREIVISSFNSVYDMTDQELNKYANTYKKALNEHPENAELSASIGMCYLKLKLYDKAYENFEKAIEEDFDNSEVFFYAAISLLKGKKAFLATKAIIDKAIELVNAAIMIENRGIYFYFLSYLKYDFYSRKSLNAFPSFEEELINARNNSVTSSDIHKLFELLCVTIPEPMII